MLLQCTNGGLCEPCDNFYRCRHHKLEVFNPNDAGCGNGIEKKERANNNTSVLLKTRIPELFTYEQNREEVTA